MTLFVLLVLCLAVILLGAAAGKQPLAYVAIALGVIALLCALTEVPGAFR